MSDQTLYREMFDVQASYLHHRLRREPWWGMDYAFGNFSQFKAICKFAPGVRMDLDEIPWRKLLVECWNAFETHRHSEARTQFVEFLWLSWGERWQNAYPAFERTLLDAKYFGCFRYDYANDGCVHLHFHNLEAPNSPLADLSKRRRDLIQIIQEIEAKELRPISVHFDSWMNNLSTILELFPESFTRSLAASEEFPKGYGWWGQFVTRDNRVHKRRAELMKETGRFEYPRLTGNCPWNDFKASAQK